MATAETLVFHKHSLLIFISSFRHHILIGIYIFLKEANKMSRQIYKLYSLFTVCCLVDIFSSFQKCPPLAPDDWPPGSGQQMD